MTILSDPWKKAWQQCDGSEYDRNSTIELQRGHQVIMWFIERHRTLQLHFITEMKPISHALAWFLKQTGTSSLLRIQLPVGLLNFSAPPFLHLLLTQVLNRWERRGGKLLENVCFLMFSNPSPVRPFSKSVENYEWFPLKSAPSFSLIFLALAGPYRQ